MIYVQFTDSTQSAIATYFAGPQDSAVYPNLGTVAVTDPRWKTFYDSMPDFIKAGMPTPEIAA